MSIFQYGNKAYTWKSWHQQHIFPASRACAESKRASFWPVPVSLAVSVKWMGRYPQCTTYSHGWNFFTKNSIGQNHPRWWYLTNEINSIPSKNYSLQTKKSRKKARFHLSFFLSQKPSIAYKTSNISRPCFFSGYSLKEKHKIPISIGKKNICRTCVFFWVCPTDTTMSTASAWPAPE